MLRYIPISNQHFQDINPLDCGEEICSPEFHIGPIIYPYYLLHYVYSGCGVFEIDGIQYPVKKGQISIIHPDKVNLYYTDKQDPWHYSWIGFESTIEIPVLKTHHIVTLPQAEHIFLDLKQSDHIVRGRELYLCSKIYELLTLFEQFNSKELHTAFDYVSKVKNHIEIHYAKTISFDHLAATLNLSRNYLGYIFKKIEGITPYQYLTSVRLSKAIALISNYGYSVNLAALSVGYPDIYTFSKAFKRKFGYPPSECIQHLS